ncbi:PSP1 C-terminal conserved region-domain-containing protein [Lentinula aff. detonsa]|nr:PSP1 C-terminal conserved region-domain-containing protein [Lentinula aff. detonsa]
MSYASGLHGYAQGHHASHPGSGHPQQQPHLHQAHPHVQHAPQHQQSHPQPEHALGRGVPLSAVPHTWKLFIVEFKAGRTDLFYLTDAVKAEIMRNEAGYAAMQSHGHANGNGNGTAHAQSEGTEGTDSAHYPIKVGDLVIVEADRGRDLGRVVNDNITVEEVEAWLDAGRSASGQILDSSQQPNQQWSDSPLPTPISPTGVYAGIPLANPNSSPGTGGGGAGSKKEINPKQIYGKAGPPEASMLAAKMSDEMKALQLCQSKVRAKKLPMEVVDAEYQWDRRKLTFYFVADKRIDFRELVRELFRLYKTRIWMASLQGGGGFEQ